MMCLSLLARTHSIALLRVSKYDSTTDKTALRGFFWIIPMETNSDKASE